MAMPLNFIIHYTYLTKKLCFFVYGGPKLGKATDFMINFAKDIKFVNIIWGMELVSNYFGRFLLRLETSLVGEGISQHVGSTRTMGSAQYERDNIYLIGKR